MIDLGVEPTLSNQDIAAVACSEHRPAVLNGVTGILRFIFTADNSARLWQHSKRTDHLGTCCIFLFYPFSSTLGNPAHAVSSLAQELKGNKSFVSVRYAPRGSFTLSPIPKASVYLIPKEQIENFLEGNLSWGIQNSCIFSLEAQHRRINVLMRSEICGLKP